MKKCGRLFSRDVVGASAAVLRHGHPHPRRHPPPPLVDECGRARRHFSTAGSRSPLNSIFTSSFQLREGFNAKEARTGPKVDIHPPTVTLMDEAIDIRASGLPPSSPVTLSVTLHNDAEKLHFQSRSFFVTSPEGAVDVKRQEALPGGSYEGVDAMGPFWSMNPLGRSGQSLLTRTAVKPLSFNVQLWPGHKTNLENTPPLAHLSALRSYLAPHIKRIPIREGRVRGTLFVPNAAEGSSMGSSMVTPKPLIMTIYGGIVRGHLIEERAAVLASKGFATFAVAFYGVDDMPKIYASTDIEYFEEALRCVTARKDIDETRVGIFGSSKGGDLALSCAAFLREKVRACLVLNACVGSFAAPTTYKGVRIPAHGARSNQVGSLGSKRPDGTVDCLGLLASVDQLEPNMIIPFADCPADLLFLAGEDDRLIESARHAHLAQTLMQRAGKSNYEVATYRGLGHVCHLPYSPATLTMTEWSVAPPDVKLYPGGGQDRASHALAQQSVWKKAVQFFAEKL